MRKLAVGCLVLVGCSGAKRSPFGVLTDDAKKALLSYCPKVVSEDRKEFPVPTGIRVDKPLEIRCTGPDPGTLPDDQMSERQAGGDIALAESDRRVVYANRSIKMRDADFDARENAFVTGALD